MSSKNCISGDDGYVVPPVPIPNTVVKHINAESTWLETAWEDRKLPVNKKDCLLTVFFITWICMLSWVVSSQYHPNATRISEVGNLRVISI